MCNLAKVPRPFCYIHCNPVAAGLAKTPEEWTFSDYAVWVGLREDFAGSAVVRDMYVGNGGEYVALLKSYLREKEDERLQKYLFDR